MPAVEVNPASSGSMIGGCARADAKVAGFALPGGRPLLAAVYNVDDTPDPVLAGLADDLKRAGLRVAGLVQRAQPVPDRSRCSMEVEIFPDGQRLQISQDRGTLARGCRLDPGLLIEALGAAEAGLRADTDILILNRFGKIEAEGGGGRDLIIGAVTLGVPVVVAVPWRNIAAFRAFAGDYAGEITLDDFAIWAAGASASCQPEVLRAGYAGNTARKPGPFVPEASA